jgi:hypothetical protein
VSVGFLRISQGAMLELQQSMEADVTTGQHR